MRGDLELVIFFGLVHALARSSEHLDGAKEKCRDGCFGREFRMIFSVGWRFL